MFDISLIPIQQIDLYQIDLNDTWYQISIPKNFRSLCQSIKEMGVMHPPVLQAKESRYRVVSGFQRILACQEIGMQQVSGRVVKSNLSPYDCARWAVTDNVFQRNLTTLEQSRALTLLENSLPDNISIQDVALQMGLPTSKRAMNQIRPLCHMSLFIQEGIAKEYIAIPIAHVLAQFSENDKQSFSKLFAAINVGLNIQRELLTTCDEIAKRDNKSLTEIITSEKVISIMREYADDRKQCVHYLREYLRTIRYPNYSKIKHQVETSIKHLKLNHQIRLLPPSHFENDSWNLQISFKNTNHLNDCLQDVLSRLDAINKIMEQDIQL